MASASGEFILQCSAKSAASRRAWPIRGYSSTLFSAGVQCRLGVDPCRTAEGADGKPFEALGREPVRSPGAEPLDEQGGCLLIQARAHRGLNKHLLEKIALRIAAADPAKLRPHREQTLRRFAIAGFAEGGQSRGYRSAYFARDYRLVADWSALAEAGGQ